MLERASVRSRRTAEPAGHWGSPLQTRGQLRAKAEPKLRSRSSSSISIVCMKHNSDVSSLVPRNNGLFAYKIIQRNRISQFVSKLSREASDGHFSFRTFALRKRRLALRAGGFLGGRVLLFRSPWRRIGLRERAFGIPVWQRRLYGVGWVNAPTKSPSKNAKKRSQMKNLESLSNSTVSEANVSTSDRLDAPMM
jgi:hypothetical protein